MSIGGFDQAYYIFLACVIVFLVVWLAAGWNSDEE
jgi:hypothetical protein